jgi:hypothetical protein
MAGVAWGLGDPWGVTWVVRPGENPRTSLVFESGNGIAAESTVKTSIVSLALSCFRA